MLWSVSEAKFLSKVIIDLIVKDLLQINARAILVLCSGDGSLVFELARKLYTEHKEDFNIVGMEADRVLLEISKKRLKNMFLQEKIMFIESPYEEIPFPDNTFHAVVSEFIVYPSPKPTNITQNEMARVLKANGLQLITDVIYTGRKSDVAKELYKSEALEYFCEATIEDFIRWMIKAGLKNIVIRDLTPIIKKVWETRLKKQGRQSSPLLEGEFAIGQSLFYTYFKAQKVSDH